MRSHTTIRPTGAATRRGGFTLVELLMVAAIMLALAGLTIAVYGGGRASDKTRSAARVSQSAFLGAKDRALHAKEFRGVRLIRDFTDPNLVNGFVFLQPMAMQTYQAGVAGAPSLTGSIRLERVSTKPPSSLAPPAAPDIIIVHGFDANTPGAQNPPPAPSTAQNGSAQYVDWSYLAQLPGAFPVQGLIRIPSKTGQWYPFIQSQIPGYVLASGNEYLQLLRPFPQPGNTGVVAWDTQTAYSSCDIQLANEVMPFHQPISLPAGIVIDLNFSSFSVLSLAVNRPNIDIMFSPRGMLSGDIVSQGPLHFVIRDVVDATKKLNPANAGVQGEIMILSVFPQTGLVQTFDADLTDVVINFGPNAGQPGADGFADNLFRFAQQGKAAGQ